jgi:hypothetical protein
MLYNIIDYIVLDVDFYNNAKDYNCKHCQQLSDCHICVIYLFTKEKCFIFVKKYGYARKITQIDGK